MNKKKSYILGLITSKKAFFMPCVMVYTIIFITFIFWQVTEVLDYKKLHMDYQSFIQYESALYNASNYVKKINEMYFDSYCISPTIPTNNKTTPVYSIEYKTYCVREPGVSNLIIPGDAIIKPAFQSINSAPSEVDQQTYEQLIITLNTIVSTEIMYEWIGLPIDAVPTKIDLVQYQSVLQMPCILFTDIKITMENKTVNILVKYNTVKQETEKVIHT